MNKSAQLVINFDKKNTFFVLKLMVIMVIGMIVALFFISKIDITLLNSLSFLSILTLTTTRIIFYLFVGFFSIGIVAAFFLLKKESKPVAILSQKGISVNHYGFISWKNIKKFTSYHLFDNKEAIGIETKNIKALSDQSDLSGKIGIFWSKLFCKPHIVLSNLDTENEKIITFARRHLKD